jgi:hypothetical protein
MFYFQLGLVSNTRVFHVQNSIHSYELLVVTQVLDSESSDDIGSYQPTQPIHWPLVIQSLPCF